jgi:hypothetical protein
MNMGYCIEMRGSNFTISADRAAAALAAIKALDPNREWSGGVRASRFSWIVTSEYMEAKDLAEAMDAWRYELRQKDNGDWVLGSFSGEKLGDDLFLFEAVAPYVKPGSFIEMQGEDGFLWRWIFDGLTCKEKAAVISWED